MAEAFARAYGADVTAPLSAGLTPAMIVAPLTIHVLAEKGIRADGLFPKGLDLASPEPPDMIVNISGFPVPATADRIVEWTVEDPIGQKEQVYRDVANQIESLVMRLILDLRAQRSPS